MPSSNKEFRPEEKYNRKTTLPWIDLMKWLFCICIVVLHSELLSLFPPVFEYYGTCLLRLAVPFFFVASGFFLGKKVLYGSKEPEYYVKQYCLRLIKPFLVFSVIWIIQRFITLTLNGEAILSVILKIIRNIVMYPLNALWYIQASIIASLLLIPFLKRDRLKWAVFWGFLLYLWALLCNNYYFIIEDSSFVHVVDIYMKVCISARNGVFVGFLFLALGMQCALIAPKIKNQNKQLKASIFIFFTLYCLEAYLIRKYEPADDGANFISHVVLIPSIVLFLVTREDGFLTKKSTVWMRNLSTGVYLLHKPILWFFTLFPLPIVFQFFFTFISSIIICFFSYRSKNPVICNMLK